MKNKKWLSRFLAALIFIQCSCIEKKSVQAMVGELCGVLALSVLAVKYFSELGKILDPIIDLSKRIKYDFLCYDTTKVSVDAKRLKDLYIDLSSNILGQNKAIGNIMKIIAGKSGVKVIYLVGSPGTGKSETIRYVNKCLYNGEIDLQPWQVVSGSDFKGASFQEVKKFVLAKESAFMQQMLRNSDVVVLFDEIDKFPLEFLNVFRNVLDSNRIPTYIETKYIDKFGYASSSETYMSTDTFRYASSSEIYMPIDASGLVLFLTSNETLEGLGHTGGKLTQRWVDEGKFETEQKALKYLQLLPWEEQEVLLRKEYGKSRTIVKRDFSLSSRFPVIEFEDLSIETLKNIFLKLFNDYNNNGCNLVLSSGVAEGIAFMAKKSRRGVRFVNEIFTQFVGMHKIFTNFETGIYMQMRTKTKVEFDQKNLEFSFSHFSN